MLAFAIDHPIADSSSSSMALDDKPPSYSEATSPGYNSCLWTTQTGAAAGSGAGAGAAGVRVGVGAGENVGIRAGAGFVTRVGAKHRYPVWTPRLETVA